MIPFFKYTSPIWYFNLNPHGSVPNYFTNHKTVYDDLLDHAVNYDSHTAKEIDYAYQLWESGHIDQRKNSIETQNIPNLTVSDNYKLLARFSKKQWFVVAFLFRLFEFRNPFKEIKGLISASKIARANTIQLREKIKCDIEQEWENFDSELIKKNPLVSVVIPTLNRYQYLKDVFKDLEKQTYRHFEVIVVDQTDDFDESQYKGWNFELRYWKQEEKALWLARNSAIKNAKGEFILLYDDDSLVDSDWVLNHLKCIDFFRCDISSGASISVVGGRVPEHYSYFRWSDQIDTGNVMLRRTIFNQVGLFDRQFEKQRMGDGEFGLRCYLEGLKNISNPKAKRIHLKVSEGGLRQMGSWDAWRPKNLLAPRPIPSVLYLSRKYFGSSATIKNIILNVLTTFIPYKYKSNKKFIIAYIPVFVLLLPLLLVSISRSWFFSSQKLRQGAKIEKLSEK